jgi:hypothetical protein
MDMQSHSLKTAQPVFNIDPVRALGVALIAFALFVIVAFAAANIRLQSLGSGQTMVDGYRPPIELPVVPGALTAPDLEAGHDALDDLYPAGAGSNAGGRGTVRSIAS